jgi:hypothetical protein
MISTSMLSLSAITTVIVHGTFITALLTIASLSKIFGAARKKKPRYKWFYVAASMLSVSMLVHLLGLDISILTWVAMALDLAGLLLGCIITYFYWEWLPKEAARGYYGKDSGRR